MPQHDGDAVVTEDEWPRAVASAGARLNQRRTSDVDEVLARRRDRAIARNLLGFTERTPHVALVVAERDAPEAARFEVEDAKGPRESFRAKMRPTVAASASATARPGQYGGPGLRQLAKAVGELLVPR